MSEGMKRIVTKVRNIGGVISPFVLAGSTILEMVDTANIYLKYIQPVVIASAIITFCYAIYYLINGKKIYEKDETIKNQAITIDLLEKNISNGIKNHKNVASVTFDTKFGKYNILIEKEYEIISDSIKWYEGQFYSNKILESSIKSQEFYAQNAISWDDLDVKAELSYKNAEEKEFSPVYELAVLRAAEGNNYKQFHIQYATKEGNDCLDIHKGAYIKLRYSYVVPVNLWGSYLNRYITYWNEDAEIYFYSRTKEQLNPQNFKLYRANDLTGDPKKIEITQDKSDRKDGLFFYKIELPKQNFTKFIVWWDANKIFGRSDLNTNLTADRSQLTQY